MIDGKEPDLWNVVLAAGDGTRLGELTRALYGTEVPKQFAVLEGGRSMLQTTLDRIAPLAPPQRTVVVVGARHEAIAREQLAEWPGLDLVVQPRNLGTGPGVLLPLARIDGRDPSANVAVFPSDHFVPRPAPLLDAVHAAIRSSHDGISLLGVAPEGPLDGFGWIVPGARRSRGSRPRSVRAFREKPGEAEAERLRAQGALVNTFILVGAVRAFRRLSRAHLPLHATFFHEYAKSVDRPHEENVRRVTYAQLPPADFSRDVLERASDLAVEPVVGSGWSDWGSAERVFASLRGTPQLESLLARARHGGARVAA